MSQQATTPEIANLTKNVPPPGKPGLGGFDVQAGEGYSEKVVDAIEMLGEEEAAGFRPPGHSEISAGMRYLHSSRTIHQLVTDRNRAVGIYLAVASLLVTASSALMNASPRGELIIAIEIIQKWCLPITFATLTVLALLVAFLLIRTRVGLIYEVAKMNALLGLPIGRVQRVGLLSIFFIMHAIVSLAGGCSAGLFSAFMLHLSRPDADAAPLAILIGVAISACLLILYVVAVRHITSDEKLQKAGK